METRAPRRASSARGVSAPRHRPRPAPRLPARAGERPREPGGRAGGRAPAPLGRAVTRTPSTLLSTPGRAPGARPVPAPAERGPRAPSLLASTAFRAHATAGSRRAPGGGPGNPARRRRRHWCVTGAPAPGLRALRPPLGPAARPRALLRAPAARPRAPRLAPLSTGGARSPGAGGREMRGKGRVSGPWSSRASGT